MPGAAAQLKALFQAVNDPTGAFSSSVTEDIDGTVLERLEYLANRTVVNITPQRLLVPPPVLWTPSAGTSEGQFPSANRAIYVPFELNEARTVDKVSVVHGSGATGNLDVGIYSAAGTRLVSSGSTAVAGVDQIQTVELANTALTAGRYYAAIALSASAALQILGMDTTVAPINGGLAFLMGLLQQATALPLPATATFATVTGSFVPAMMLEFA